MKPAGVADVLVEVLTTVEVVNAVLETVATSVDVSVMVSRTGELSTIT